jgi:predicted nucleic acid-binding protein
MNETENRMRVFLDTNVLFSAIVYPTSVSRRAFEEIILHHIPVICEYSLIEIQRILKAKSPHVIAKWDRLITTINFELAYTPTDQLESYPVAIRDKNDLPILVSAYLTEPDLLVSGDKDFHSAEIKEFFAVCTPSEFLQWFSPQE